MNRVFILILVFISASTMYAKTFDTLTSKIDVDIANRYFKKGDYEKSIELYEKVLTKNSNSYKIYNNLALAKYANGDKNEALALFDIAKKNVSTNEKKGMADLYFNSGILNASSEKYKEAIDDLIESLKLNPKDDRAREALEYSRKRLKESQNNKDNKENKSNNNNDENNKPDNNNGNDNNNNNNDNNNSDDENNRNEDNKNNDDSKNEQSLRDDEIEQLLNSLRNFRKDDSYKNENLGNGYNSEKDW